MAINWTSGLLSGIGLNDQLKRLGEVGDDAIAGVNNLTNDAKSYTEFKPFTVSTGGFGNTQTDANGNLSYNLNPEQKKASWNQITDANSLFAGLTQPTGAREAEVYDRIRATQMPEEQRAAEMMDSRLTGQGRSGIRSAQYGGTPEQLAYHKAVEEAKNNASLAAIGQAQTERMNDATLGGLLTENAYTPLTHLQNTWGQGLKTGELKQGNDLGTANILGELGILGLQTGLNAEVARSNLLGEAIGAASGALQEGTFDPLGTVLGGLFGKVLEGWGGNSEQPPSAAAPALQGPSSFGTATQPRGPGYQGTPTSSPF